ncbi:YopT-type cysteine protease domain-containing protein [Pasteurella canis]|uniref:YopT-type cysteine protease domain-containing protein n=1 Tax=Pasteurella canis TaxID=753 RepID=UPI000D86180D|nr:YopT-type cysteine protease domain-containing protein [Pasteurella canis]SPY33682.1 filamentous hemagglutinin protein [Pasteurella canis]
MNKNRYKLIFSKSKSCLVPVAECIKSAMGNGSSDSVSNSSDEAEEPPLSDHYALSPVSLSLKSALNPVSSVMQLTWKQFSILLLTVVSAPSFSQEVGVGNGEKARLTEINNGNNSDIQLSTKQNGNNHHNTKLQKTENNVIVIDIATPNSKGISDNHFERFNIPNGAVFNNNGSEAEMRSKLIGYIPHNQNLRGDNKKEADVILSQVTGNQESKIAGALEVLGKKADIVIANQNGINLNGVRTINSDRFIATTSQIIDPQNMLLDVTRGKVTIGVNGFATDGLKYLDIIAKTIEQKQSITTEKDKTSDTEISFIAGKSKYDFKKREVTEKNGENVKEGTIAITGASTGAMHGKNIKLIVTDKGAGVKHDGIILSENDIHIELHDGDLEFGNVAEQTPKNLDRKVQAKKKIEVKGANRTILGSQVKADEIDIATKETKIRSNTEVRAKNTKVKSDNKISLEQNAKLVATKVDVKTESLTNDGRIYGREVTLDANDLVNNKEIVAETKLDIQTKGKNMSISEQDYVAARLLESSASLKPGFVNKGIIESKEEATLTFKDQTSYLAEKDDKFVKAGKKLTINAENVEFDQQDIQLSAKIDINVEKSFINRNSTLATAQELNITAKQGSIYNIGGILGSAQSLHLKAESSNGQGGNVVNQEGGLLHSLGEMNLDATHTVYNLGNIWSHKKIKVEAHKLINDVRLSGKVAFKENELNGLIQNFFGNNAFFKLDVNLSGRLYEMSQIAQHGWHNNVYKLNLNVQELDKADIKVEKMGMIRSDDDFEFKARKLASGDQKTEIINHGLINIKGTFTSDADKITNQMKAFESNALETVFRNPAKITFYYQPLARFFLTALSGNASREFDTLEKFLDALFSNQSILTSFNYSAENFNAYKILSHVQHSEIYQKAMAQVFGAEWHALSYDEMKTRWQAFKDKPTNFNYYPAEKAKILASKFEAKTGELQNGEHSQYDNFDGNIKIDTHQLTLPKVEFRPEFSSTESLDDGAIDLSAIAELLDMPNLFIDSSVQLEKEGLVLKPLDHGNDGSSSGSDIDSDEDSDSDEEEIKPPRTDRTVDYLNPEEYLENGYLLNDLLKELNQESFITENYFDRPKNVVHIYEIGDKIKDPTFINKVENLFRQKQKEQALLRKQSVEQSKVEVETQQVKRLEQDKQEEKRQERDKVAKKAEIAKEVKQAEEIRTKEKELAIEIKVKEEKRKEEVRVAKEKQKAEKQKKAAEKAAYEKREVEAKQAFEQNAQYEADAAKNASLKVIDDNRPKVETDPLYRTKLKYINQDEYAGANYFFNKLGLDTQGTQKVNVLGDNYFDHQLITRAIEKKADNRLNQKYNLTDVELVKKLMENSTEQAKALDLKLGAGLTKEQQSKLTEDIVWYVKTNVNGKEVFVPQVYFAPETIAETKKLQGLGTGVISAGEVNIKAENVTNTGTIAGDKVKIEASNKIQNKGSILSTEETRLVGRKGIENLSRSFANDELGVTAQRSEIKTEGHLHLETDKDASVDVQASDIKAKSGFVKTGDVNLKDTYNTKHSYEETIQHAGLHTMTLESGGMSVPTVALASPESHSKQESQATSVGSKVDIGQLHLAVENDVNQVGSELKSNRISGIVKGNYNTEAGKNVKHVKREDYTSGLYGSAHASGGGTSIRYDYDSKEGGKAANVPTSQTGAGVELGVSLTHEKESATLLTHTNSELQVESGKLHVLGHADIGGVDINTKIPEKAQDKAAPQDTAASNNDKAAPSNIAEANKPSSNEGPIFRTLSEEEIAELMSEKSKDYFEQQAKTAPEQGFELSAKEIKSTKQKDEYTLESTKTTFKIGAEAEAHSAVADLVSHIVKEYRDAQNGIKQDGTAALQYASDALNIVTGDLAGTSAKVSVERNHETKNTKETGDIVTKIGGNVTLSAHSGNVELRNIQSDKNTNLTLKAKEDINILAGEKTRQSNETVSRQKVATGVNAGCSMMSGACTAGTSSSIEGNESYTSENSLTHNNSLLQGQNIKLEAGRDLNLESSNIEANNVDLNIEGTTNIISKQDTLQKSTHGFDYNLSAGVALSSATIATPTGNIGAGYTNETETKRTVNQQAGIKANKLTGKTQNLNLEAGYIANNDKSGNFKVQGNVTTKELHDHHDKDGGSFGMSVGISERGTTAFNVRGGRADQKHYNATQKSTLSGVDTSKAQVSGSVNTNLANAKEVTRDDTYASTQFAFEVGDLAELGQRAKNKIKSSSLTGVPDLSTANTRVRNGDDAPQTRARSVETDVDVSTPKSRLLDNTSDSVTVKNPIYESADSLSSTPRRNSTDNDAVSVKNPIYESIESVGATPRARNTDSSEMGNNPLYSTVTPRTKATTEAESATAKAHVYEEIPLMGNDTPRNKLNNDTHEYAEVGKGPYSTLGDINSDRVRNKVANTDDPTYAKVGPEGTYSKLGDSSSDITRNKSLANDAHEYAEVGKGPYSTLGDINSDRVRNKVTNTDDPTYAKVGPEGTYSKLGDENVSGSRVKPNNTTEGTYSTVGDGHSDIARRSTNTPEYAEVQPRTRRSATDKLPEIPTAKARVTTDAEGVYSEINTAGTRRQATDPLPELPQFAQPKAKTDSDSAEHIYEDISNLTNRSTRRLPTLPNAKVRTDSEAEYTTITTVPKTRSAKDALPDVPTGKAKVEVDNDGIYSQISDVATAQPRIKSTKVESDYETIPVSDSDSVAPKVVQPSSKRALTEEVTSVDTKVRSVSEEISDSVVNKTKSTTEEIYSTLDKSVEGRARANAKADEALATQNTVRHKARVEDETPPLLPKRLENLTAEVETQTSVNTAGKVTGPEAQVSEQGKLRSRVTDGDYATVEDVIPTPRSKTDRLLPQTPEAQTQLRNRVKVEGDYAEVVDTVSTLRSKADRELPKLPNEAVAKSRLSSVEGDYAEIGNVTTPRLQQPKASVEPQSLLAEANTNNNSNRAKKVDIKDASTESPATTTKAEKSWLSKVRDFFSGSSSRNDTKDDATVKVLNTTKELKDTSNTIPDNSKAQRDLPEVPTDLRVRKVLNESDYAEIGEFGPTAQSQQNAKVRIAEDLSKISSKVKTDDELYATVDKSPEALARARARDSEAAVRKPVVEISDAEDNFAPLLPIRPELKDAAGMYKPSKLKAENKMGSHIEDISVFQRIKQLFIGDKSFENTAKIPQGVEPQMDIKPNYSSLAEVSKITQSKAQRDLPDIPTQLNAKKVVNESDYAEIGELGQIIPKVRMSEDPSTGLTKVKTNEDLYATIDKSPEARARAKARGDEAAAKNVIVKKAVEDSDIAPALPPRPSEFSSTVESTAVSKAPAKEKPPIAPKPKVILENDIGGVAKTRVVVQPEVADAPQLKSRQVANSDYAEIVDGVPQLQPRAKARQTMESDYEDIDTFVNTQSTAKTRTTEEVAVPNKLKVDDGLYATVDKRPEALAKAKARGDEAAAAQAPTRKVQVEDELPPALPKRSADLTEDDHASTQGTAERQFRSLPVDVEATDVVSTPQATAKAKPVSERIQQKELVEQSRGVLKQVQDQFQPLKVKHKIDAVRSSVEEYGGEVTFKYAQSKGEVYKEIVKHLETQHGVCESTCAHWIAKKVDPQDDNFWTSLYEGGQKGHLKKEAIDSIKKLQTEFINSGSATQQFKLTDSWLQEQGVVPKEKKFGNLSRRDEVAGTVSKTDVSALSKAILDTGNETSAVKKISINLEGGSHTVSAAIQGQKVVFFDPNFGEMTFPTHQKFDKWLKEAFWDKSGYAGKNEGKRFFNVVNYELPAKASDSNVGKVKATTEANDVNFKARTSSNSEASSTESAIQIRKDAVSGESYVMKDNVVTAITNTQYVPKPISDVDAQFEKVRQKAKSADSAKEAEKKLALIAKEAKNLPKEHLLKATDELVNGMSTEDRRALRQQEHKVGAVLPSNNVIKGFEGKNVKSMGKILKNVQFDEGYVETRKQINEKIVEKLDSNKEFHDLMKGKLSGNEEGIRKLFDIVETAKRESLKEVTGIEGTKAKLELNTKNGPLSMGQGHYANDEVHMNSTPIASFLRSKKRNNQEILDTILHELTHHDQAQITKNKYDANLPDNLKKDANLLALNENYYIDADVSNFGAYKQQPLEREAFSSGHSLSKELGKLVERGYQGKVQEIETIEHLPNKLNNLESPREAQASLGDNALIYGLQQGRKELIAKANAADAEGKNAILADSYIGKLNLGFEFAQLSSFAKQVKSGNVTEQDIQEIASFNEPTAKLARRDDSKNRINDANIEDNQRIIRELIKNENAVDALKRIATLTDQEQSMYDALRKNDKFDMEELQESSNYTTAENSAIREYKNTQNALNDARMDFFAEKTKFIAKETLERGGQLYFALDGLATDTMTFRANTKIDLNRLKEVFDPNNPHYDSVTSRELRYLYENYKDHPNLKFTIKDHVIENPFKTLEIPTTENTVSSSEQNTVYKKQLLPSLFKRKAKSDGPKIEHLGGSTEKDAFYFPLDKIVTKDRGISKDMKVNMENIKKAFNPRDKHYDSVEARNLRALYEQDPTMSSTRFVIGNQVIENPFKSPELQDYIKKHHVRSPVAAKTAKPLPALPKTGSKEQTVQKVQQTAPKKPVQPPKPKAEKVVDPNAIYAQVNKNRKTAEVEGFYPESQLRTRSDKIVEQVSHVPTTEPTYADLQFSHKTNRVQSRSENEVIYDKVAAPVKGTSPKTTAKPQKPQKPLSKGIIPESQLKTRSDKIAEQVSRVPMTEPTYAELQFVNKPAAKHETPKDVVYEEVATKGKSKNAKPLTKPQKPKQQLNKGIIPESQLRTRSDKMAEQVSHVPTTEPVYADIQFPASSKTQRAVVSPQETIYEEVGKRAQEEPIYQNVIRQGVNNK